TQIKGRIPMRALSVAAVFAMVLAMGHRLEAAPPPLTSCALAGLYVVAATLHGEASAGQLSGQFTFAPPASCGPGETGLVDLRVTVLVVTDSSPQTIAASVPYLVDAAGVVRIGGFFRGAVGGVTDGGIANSVVFEADTEALSPTVRLAGTA